MSEMSLDHQEFQEELAIYALGSLDAADRRRIEAHLGECADCRELLREYQVVASLLPFGLEQSEPPAGAEARLQEQARRPGRWRLRRWLTNNQVNVPRYQGLAAAILLLLIAVLVVWNLSLQFGDDHPPDGTVPVSVVAPLAGSEFAPLATGHLVLDLEDGTSVLIVSGLPELDAEHAYQLWFVRSEAQERVSGGVFEVNPAGAGVLAVVVPEEVTQYDLIGVTEEPAGGSPGPTGRNVLRGELQPPADLGLRLQD